MAESKTERQKMVSGELYFAGDAELDQERGKVRRLLNRLNTQCDLDIATGLTLVREIFGTCDDTTAVQMPFFCDYGWNIHVGCNFYCNYNCCFLDCAPIHIGDSCFFAPNVQLYTATHPLNAKTRCDLLELAKPIRIGNRCWLGGGAIVLPGVTIGDDVVVGAGAVVTKDVPSGVLVVGNPARVIRQLEADESPAEASATATTDA
eukprot:gnl/Trimastix_PCT/4316.p1 GENE.gnl/Trimastix_PCT/4316~~gnl/Trimastix_PCT/4316.p1  ORF type:complete len:205 (+),score=19.06 gnl/Trimastix_PCT/4316:47-661(+)